MYFLRFGLELRQGIGAAMVHNYVGFFELTDEIALGCHGYPLQKPFRKFRREFAVLFHIFGQMESQESGAGVIGELQELLAYVGKVGPIGVSNREFEPLDLQFVRGSRAI